MAQPGPQVPATTHRELTGPGPTSADAGFDVSSQPLDLQGWSPSGSVYEDIIASAQKDVRLIIEVGVWKGLSFSYLTEHLRKQGQGVAFAVDTWLGALEFWTRSGSRGAPDPTRDLAFRNGYPQVYFQFLANVVQAGLAEFVLPFPATSRLASAFLKEKGVRADLIHIDAGHSYEDAKEDIEHWWPLLRQGGVMLGDDFRPSWPGVVRAACEHAATHGHDEFYISAVRPRHGEPQYMPWRSAKWWITKRLAGHSRRGLTEQQQKLWLRNCTRFQNLMLRAPPP